MASRPIYKSRAMLRLEARLGRSLEEYLEAAYRSKTQTEIATDLGVSNASVSRWMRELEIESRNQGARPPEAVA